jgi:hypothetical protein
VADQAPRASLSHYGPGEPPRIKVSLTVRELDLIIAWGTTEDDGGWSEEEAALEARLRAARDELHGAWPEKLHG